jgi:hypothetical protein
VGEVRPATERAGWARSAPGEPGFGEPAGRRCRALYAGPPDNVPQAQRGATARRPPPFDASAHAPRHDDHQRDPEREPARGTNSATVAMQ